MENLLAFIELVQFKGYVQDKLNLTYLKTDNNLIMNFPSNIPFSAILEETESTVVIQDIKLKACRIYQKYVAVGSQYEINISGAERGILTQNLHNIDELLDNEQIKPSDMFTMFDNCIQEMWQLLGFSYTRFRTQPEYNEFHQPFLQITTSISMSRLTTP